MKVVRRPRIDLDARGRIQTHGKMTPIRGDWHTTECGDATGITELEGVVGFWERQGLGYGAHVIIDKDGNSALCSDLDQVTWHTENRNTGMIGIELIGFARFVPKIWWARRTQLDKLARWIAWINKEYGIPIRFSTSSAWSGHIDQTIAYNLPSGHTDPGKWFPKGYVLRLARKYRKQGWD